MIPANQTTLAETAYSLAIECAEGHARRFHRLSFWVPIWGREFQIKAKMWDYTVQRLKKHAQFLGPKSRRQETVEVETHDFRVPARPEHLFSVGE